MGLGNLRDFTTTLWGMLRPDGEHLGHAMGWRKNKGRSAEGRKKLKVTSKTYSIQGANTGGTKRNPFLATSNVHPESEGPILQPEQQSWQGTSLSFGNRAVQWGK